MFSYFLRHFLVWFRARGRVSNFNEEFDIRFRSWPTDCDSNFHVNTARYFVFMELARFDLSLKSGLFSYCLKNKIALLVMGAKITYRREIKPFKRINIRTKVIGYDERFMYIEQRIISNLGTHSKGYLRIAMYKDGKFFNPDNLVSDLNLTFEQQPFPEDVKLWIEAEDLVLKDIKG